MIRLELSLYFVGYITTLLVIYLLRKNNKESNIKGIHKDDLIALLIWPIFGGYAIMLGILKLIEMFFGIG